MRLLLQKKADAVERVRAYVMVLVILDVQDALEAQISSPLRAEMDPLERAKAAMALVQVTAQADVAVLAIVDALVVHNPVKGVQIHAEEMLAGHAVQPVQEYVTLDALAVQLLARWVLWEPVELVGKIAEEDAQDVIFAQVIVGEVVLLGAMDSVRLLVILAALPIAMENALADAPRVVQRVVAQTAQVLLVI